MQWPSHQAVSYGKKLCLVMRDSVACVISWFRNKLFAYGEIRYARALHFDGLSRGQLLHRIVLIPIKHIVCEHLYCAKPRDRRRRRTSVQRERSSNRMQAVAPKYTRFVTAVVSLCGGSRFSDRKKMSFSIGESTRFLCFRIPFNWFLTKFYQLIENLRSPIGWRIPMADGGRCVCVHFQFTTDLIQL